MSKKPINLFAMEHQNSTPEISSAGAIWTDAKLCQDINRNSKNLNNIEKHQVKHENSEEKQIKIQKFITYLFSTFIEN